MTEIKSPYKLQQDRTREVTFDASHDDFRDFKFRFSAHGSIDAVLANLFYQFMQAARSQLPLADSTEVEDSNIVRFNQMISTLNIRF